MSDIDSPSPSSPRRIRPVILSGGAGTRLWPLSRQAYPKQLLALTGERSPFQETLSRVGDPARFLPPLVVGNQDHRFLLAEQLRALGREAAGLVLEPLGRNTAPAVCAAALIAAETDPESLLLILPSDHRIEDSAGSFEEAVERAARAASLDWLVTFGVRPDRPETGYGYICAGEPLEQAPGARRVERFVEKPERETAEAYLAEGRFTWNSGMFLFTAKLLLAEMERLAPEILNACRTAVAGARHDLDFLRLDESGFGAAPDISLDYAILEKTERAATVPLELDWSDLGSWDALWEIDREPAAGNALQGDVLALETNGSLLRSERGLLAVLGVENLIVVATTDAVLVCPRERSQDVRALTAALREKGRSEALEHARVYRPWGSYQSVDRGERFQVKRLIVEPGARLSLQSHNHRAEHWVVVEGTAEVTRGEEILTLRPNESV
ncbi:MAG: mannose-1-phosphate guanylyltransferase/mannose-6-phosphate isomerase, partial [Acidobacteriota bacterium]